MGSDDDTVIIRGKARLAKFSADVKAAAVAPVYGPVKRWHIAVFALVVVLILV